jgi:hypothetical protein
LGFSEIATLHKLRVNRHRNCEVFISSLFGDNAKIGNAVSPVNTLFGVIYIPQIRYEILQTAKYQSLELLKITFERRDFQERITNSNQIKTEKDYHLLIILSSNLV